MLSINKNCVPMYYINLDKRTLRRKDFEKQMKLHDLSVERISAFDGSALPERISPYIRKGAYGCWMSHIETWKKVKEKNTPCVIFEDDIILCDNFCEKINAVLDDSKNVEWDMLLLGHNWCNKKDKITKYISQMFKFYGTQCYVIKPKCAEFLLNKYNNFQELGLALDVQLGDINVKKEIKIVASTEKLVTLSKLSRGSDTIRG